MAHELIPYNPPGELDGRAIFFPERERSDPSDQDQEWHETREPHHPPTLESDVFVPGAQAGLSFVVAALCLGLLAWALVWSWRVVAVGAALSLAFAWLWRLRLAGALLWRVEHWTERAPQAEQLKPAVNYLLANPSQARADVTREQRERSDQARQAALLAFVDKCYLRGTAEQAHGIRASGPDRNEYTAARDALLRLGVAVWKNPARTRGGWRMAVSRQRARSLIEKHVL